jgi:hypothetical protein
MNYMQHRLTTTAFCDMVSYHFISPLEMNDEAVAVSIVSFLPKLQLCVRWRLCEVQ